MEKCRKGMRWKVVDSSNKIISQHRIKKQAEKAQKSTNRADRYVKRC